MRRFVGGTLLACLVGCSAPTTEVSESTLPPTTTAAPATAGEAVAVFGACMQAAGFDLSEIAVDDEGRPDMGALAGDVATDPSFRQAVTLCAGPLSEFLGLENSPGLRVMVRAQLQDYAGCMRASGVEDFPDPVADFDGTFAPFPPEQIPTEDPDFGPAVEACAAALGLSGE
ncbi:MAG TPA: hypothetical protein VIB78_06915 [Acidimicrobiia bacterium]